MNENTIFERDYMTGKVVKATSKDSIWIDDAPYGHLQIPTSLVLSIDSLLTTMREMGNVSPDFRIWIGETPEGPTMWNCAFGSFVGSSLTPWGAIQNASEKVTGSRFK